MDLTLAQEKEYEEAKAKIDEALTVRSRSYLGLCKNDGCYGMREKCSSFCKNCSEKNKGLR